MRLLELTPLAVVLTLAGCGEGAPPPATATGEAPSTTSSDGSGAAPDAVAAVDGEAVYNRLCITCHGAGIAGAPKLGDAAEWGSRIGQGTEILYDHSINGFTGTKGMMPARGGNPALGDAEVRAAVDYMVGAVR